MYRILFALYLPLMLAPIPVGAQAKKAVKKPAVEKSEQKLASNYDNPELSYTLEIAIKTKYIGKKK